MCLLEHNVLLPHRKYGAVQMNEMIDWCIERLFRDDLQQLEKKRIRVCEVQELSEEQMKNYK